MSKKDIFAVNCKMVTRYLKPLLFNLNPIYIHAELVTTSKGREYVMVVRQDGEEIPIDVTEQAASDIVKTVMNELF